MISRLKLQRFLSGKSQDELAGDTGVSQAQICRIEKGHIKPKEADKEKLARALNTTTEELFSED